LAEFSSLITAAQFERLLERADEPEALTVLVGNLHASEGSTQFSLASTADSFEYQPLLDVPMIRRLYLRNITRFYQNLNRLLPDSDGSGQWIWDHAPAGLVEDLRAELEQFGNAGSWWYESVQLLALLTAGKDEAVAIEGLARSYRIAKESWEEWECKHLVPLYDDLAQVLSSMARLTAKDALADRASSTPEEARNLFQLALTGQGLWQRLPDAVPAVFVFVLSQFLERLFDWEPVVSDPRAWSAFLLAGLYRLEVDGKPDYLEALLWIEVFLEVLNSSGDLDN
jgi:hypothetical protein